MSGRLIKRTLRRVTWETLNTTDSARASLELSSFLMRCLLGRDVSEPRTRRA